MSNHFNINPDGTVEETEDVTMVEETVNSETHRKSTIDFNGKWSAYSKPESYPFKTNVHLRYNRFNMEKNYTLGDVNETDAKDEMTYMHWIHNFLSDNLIDKCEIITTSVDFEETINFSTNLIVYRDRTKYMSSLRKHLSRAISASSMIFTPSEFETNYFNVPIFKHFYFLDNIAKLLISQNRSESNCDFTYNSFKENELYKLTQLIKELRFDNYKNITDGITDTASESETFSYKKNFKVEINTKTPMFCYLTLNIKG